AAVFLHPNPDDRFVQVIAHEYVHTLQALARDEPGPGDPRATVLRMSLLEGAAEVDAELVSGSVSNIRHAEWTRGRELEIETAFQAAMHGSDLRPELYNYRPGPGETYDPSYRVAYRIPKAYYLQAEDKRAAVARIIDLDDPDAFLRDSGWFPGMRLDDARAR